MPNDATRATDLALPSRQAIEDTIERLICMLDEIDGDTDLEPDVDAEAINEDGGDILDEPHDDDDPAEESDTGIGDHDGLIEQEGMLLSREGYEAAVTVRTETRQAIKEAMIRKGQDMRDPDTVTHLFTTADGTNCAMIRFAR